MNKTRQALTYLILDLLVSSVAYVMFFYLRVKVLPNTAINEGIPDDKVWAIFGQALIIAIYWIIIYSVAGLYTEPYRKSRMHELGQIFKFTFLGVLIIFFAIFLDDVIPNNTYFYYYIYYFVFQFVAIGFIHFFISTQTNTRIRRRKIGFPTLLIGSGKKAMEIWTELNGMKKSLGFDIKGFLSLEEKKENTFYGKLKNFGTTSRLIEVIQNRRIQEVIIALDKENRDKLKGILDTLEMTPIYIKIVPDLYDYIIGSVKMTHIHGAPLIEIYPRIISTWESVVKRMMDIFVSIAVLVLLFPILLFVAILIKLSSKGPIFFTQERIGKRGIPFNIIKFRSMRTDAEESGPALSSDNDPRITSVGRFLRKTRLDEFPNFINVLKGEMSLVGPRPERQFFIDQIVKTAPHYRHLHKVRPGITSWGQVKFGYAENVDQMLERLKFDILYIENMSLALDIKILLYTVLIIFEGRGK